MNQKIVEDRLAIALEDIDYIMSNYTEVEDIGANIHKASFTITFTGFGVALITTELLSTSLLVTITYTSKAYKTVTDSHLFDVSEQGLATFNRNLRTFLLTAKVGGDVRV